MESLIVHHGVNVVLKEESTITETNNTTMTPETEASFVETGGDDAALLVVFLFSGLPTTP